MYDSCHTHICKKKNPYLTKNKTSKLESSKAMLPFGAFKAVGTDVKVSRPSLIPLSVCLGRHRGSHACLDQWAGKGSWLESQAQYLLRTASVLRAL